MSTGINYLDMDTKLACIKIINVQYTKALREIIRLAESGQDPIGLVSEMGAIAKEALDG